MIKMRNLSLLPLGLVDFSNIRQSNMIYVDKTGLISQIARQRAPIFFSRPRRFGKSLLINTLSCLFEKGIEYFHGLEIEKNWNDATYQVIHLDFSSLARKKPKKFVEDFGELLLDEFGMKGKIARKDEFGVRSPDRILSEIVKKLSNNSVVLLVDEYDAPLIYHIDKQDELEEIVNVLNDFYAVVKQYFDKFRFLFITGVARISHTSIFSAFNNLIDKSLDGDLNALLGFTQEEVEQFFDPYVENAANILSMRKDDVYTRLEQYYDGYKFCFDDGRSLYNPWSLLNFFSFPEKGYVNYWFDSGGPPSIIMQYLKITSDFDFLNYDKRDIVVDKNELSQKFEINTINKDILLYQTGYFSLRNGCLVLPNIEVEESLLLLYLRVNNIRTSCKLRQSIEKIVEYIDSKNILGIVEIFNAILNECVSSLSAIFNDERSARDILYATLVQVSNLQVLKERDTAKGRSDLELITQKTCLCIEFKRTYPNHRGPRASLEKALEQLKDTRYGVIFSQSRILYRLGMVISTEQKAILPDFCQEAM